MITVKAYKYGDVYSSSGYVSHKLSLLIKGIEDDRAKMNAMYDKMIEDAKVEDKKGREVELEIVPLGVFIPCKEMSISDNKLLCYYYYRYQYDISIKDGKVYVSPLVLTRNVNGNVLQYSPCAYAMHGNKECLICLDKAEPIIFTIGRYGWNFKPCNAVFKQNLVRSATFIDDMSKALAAKWIIKQDLKE